MTYGTHMLGGALLSIAVMTAAGTDQSAAAGILGGAVVGALLPDIDHTRSKISKSNLGTSIVSDIVSLFTKHRGIIHTPICMIILAMLCSILMVVVPKDMHAIAVEIAEGILIGYFSHLLLDTFNPGGIMWLYPISKKYFHIAQIKTGTIGEVLVAGGMTLVLALFSIQYFNMTGLYDETLYKIRTILGI